MHWIVDHPQAVYLALGAGAIIYLAIFWAHKRVRDLGNAGIFIALLALFWLLSQFIMTDRKLIHQTLRQMADAVIAGDGDALFTHVARDFRYHDLNRDTTYQAVRKNIKHFSIQAVHLWDYEVPELSRSDRKARVEFKATVSGPDMDRMFLIRSDFVLEEGAWKMQSFRVFNPIVNTTDEFIVH